MQIVTYSGMDASAKSIEKYMQYDYNYAAGWIAVANYPKIISTLSITTTIGKYFK